VYDVDELIDWYRAQLDDDEQVALAAARATGYDPEDAEWDVAPDGAVRPRGAAGDSWIAVGPADGRAEIGRHIARHGPAQVLREIHARRLMLKSGIGDRGLRVMLLPYAGRPGYRDEWWPDYPHPTGMSPRG
jgi:hypothetical protein